MNDLKLHLGCGQKYLWGYVNIDFPLSEHTVQTDSVADKIIDITKLKCPKDSIEEIRLHHVFEHFQRPIALALILSWGSWLKKDGVLRIEVPDFFRTTINVLSPFTSPKTKSVAIRHIFGSQEASWAVHYEGWTERRLKHLFSIAKFDVKSISKTQHKDTYNIEVIAQKNNKIISKKEIQKIAKKYLSQFLLDNSKSEKKMLCTWLKSFNKQLNSTYSDQ